MISSPPSPLSPRQTNCEQTKCSRTMAGQLSLNGWLLDGYLVAGLYQRHEINKQTLKQARKGIRNMSFVTNTAESMRYKDNLSYRVSNISHVHMSWAAMEIRYDIRS